MRCTAHLQAMHSCGCCDHHTESHEQGETRHEHGRQLKRHNDPHATCQLCISYRGEMIVATLFQRRLSFV